MPRRSRVLLGRPRRRQQLERRAPATSSCAARAAYPVPLRYLFEGRQGKSNALNTGMAAAQAAGHRVHRRRRRGGTRLAAGRGRSRCSSGRTSTTPAGRSGRSGAAPRPGVARRTRQSRRHDRREGSRLARVRLRGRPQDAARREHGRAPVADRTNRRVPPRSRTQRQGAARPGTGGVLLPIAAGGRARALRARRWCSTTSCRRRG